MKAIEELTDNIDEQSIRKIKFDRSHRGICWINTNLEVAYLGIPKCGNSMLRYQLTLDPGIVDIGEIPSDFFLFSVIREPTERLVSAYIEVIQDCKSFPGGRFRHDLEISQDKIDFLDNHPGIDLDLDVTNKSKVVESLNNKEVILIS